MSSQLIALHMCAKQGQIARYAQPQSTVCWLVCFGHIRTCPTAFAEKAPLRETEAALNTERGIAFQMHAVCLAVLTPQSIRAFVIIVELVLQSHSATAAHLQMGCNDRCVTDGLLSCLRYERINSQSHFAPWTDPEPISRSILGFLKK